MFPPQHTGRDGLASSFALRRSGCGTKPKPDEHHWRDILTTGFEPRPRLPRLASSDCRVRLGGLLPDTVAQPSPILTAFPHFQRCFDIGLSPRGKSPSKNWYVKTLCAVANQDAKRSAVRKVPVLPEENGQPTDWTSSCLKGDWPTRVGNRPHVLFDLVRRDSCNRAQAGGNGTVKVGTPGFIAGTLEASVADR